MAFPAKTDRERILAAAMVHLARDGMAKLSLRSVAATLELAPNALYRYFASRGELQAALVAEITRRVHDGLGEAAAGKEPEPAIYALAEAYLVFAREQRHLYDAFLTPCVAIAEGEAAHDALWEFVLGQVTRVAGPEKAADAAVGLWAFLHGFAELQALGVFAEGKPSSGFAWGMLAWITAAGDGG